MRQPLILYWLPCDPAMGFNGMCHLNAAIPCLMQESPALGGWQGPKGVRDGMNPLGSICPSSGDGKHKEAMATRKLIFPNLPMFNPKKSLCFLHVG